MTPTAPLFDVNCSILLTDLPLAARPAAARAAGFDAVEFWWPFATASPTDHDVDAFVAAIRDAGVALVGLNFFAGDMAAGDRGVLSNPKCRSEFRDSVDISVGIGEQLRCRSFNALYGNRLPDLNPQTQDDEATENLRYAAQSAARSHATVLLEAVSGAPAYPLLRAADVANAMQRIGEPNVAFLADLYHLGVNGDDVPAVITDYADTIGHVQIADAPGRGAPGSGTSDIEQQLDTLHTAGYRGWIGLEYRSDAADPFAWLPPEQRGTAPSSVAAPRSTGGAR